MYRALALISGKGGSGKTTLALSMASMMSKFGIRVLLIDCDLCTNGASFFYENKISESHSDIISFYGMISGNLRGIPVKINTYLDFIPSVVRITKENTSTYTYNKNDSELINNFKTMFQDKYDVIIFDCQAGFTDTLHLILPLADINLIVMEPDAISSATIRGLYLKIGDYLNERNVYQVFNKVTEGEYKVYSKISGGTVFINIESIVFDWKIRRAFSVSQIPDMDSTSATYGSQIYNICKILFKSKLIQDKLKKYDTVIEINKKKEEQKQIEEELNKLVSASGHPSGSKERILQQLLVLLLCISTSIMVYSLSKTKIFSENDLQIIALFPLITIVFTAFFLALINVWNYHKSKKEWYDTVDKYMIRVEELKNSIRELEHKHETDINAA